MNPQNSQQALGQLQTAQQTAQNPQSFLASQQQALGVPAQQEAVQGLRGAISNTTKLLNNVAPSVTGRAANSLVNAGAAQRIIANEQAPIAANLQTQGQQYSQSAQDLADLQNKALQQAQLQYQGQQDQVSYLQNLYNTLYAREQDAANRALQEKKLRAESAAASGYGLGGGSAAAPAQKSAYATQKGSGFQFYDAGDKPITAAQYAQQTGKSIGDVLYTMAKAGDPTATELYGQLQAVAKSPKLYQQTLDAYKKSLPWVLGGV